MIKAMTPSETPITYKGFTIKEIYQSADGKGNHDYFIYSDDLPLGEVKMGISFKKLMEYIDTKSKKTEIWTK